MIIVDDTLGALNAENKGSEAGLCYLANQQIDRSPTGSGVAARIALAHAKGKLGIGESWTYHLLLSNVFGGTVSFTGCVTSIEEEVFDVNGHTSLSVRVRVEGFAYYTGFHSFFVEEFPIQLGSRASFSISSVSNDAGVSHLHTRSVFIKVEMLISTLFRALTNDEPRTVTWVFNTPT